MNKTNIKFLFLTVVFIGLFIFMLGTVINSQSIVYGAEPPQEWDENGYPHPEPIVYPTEEVGYPYPVPNDPIIEVASDPYGSIVTIVVASYDKKPSTDFTNIINEISNDTPNEKIKDIIPNIATIKLYEIKYFIQHYGMTIFEMR